MLVILIRPAPDPLESHYVAHPDARAYLSGISFTVKGPSFKSLESRGKLSCRFFTYRRRIVYQQAKNIAVQSLVGKHFLAIAVTQSPIKFTGVQTPVNAPAGGA